MDFFSLPEGMDLPPAFDIGWGRDHSYGGGGFGEDTGFQDEEGFRPDDTRGVEGGLPPDATAEQIAEFEAESDTSGSACAPGDTLCEQGSAEGEFGLGPEDTRTDCAPGDTLCEQGGGIGDYWDMSEDDVGGRPGEFNNLAGGDR